MLRQSRVAPATKFGLFALCAAAVLAGAWASAQKETIYSAPLESHRIALEYKAEGGLGHDGTVFRVFGDGRLTKRSVGSERLLAEKNLSPAEMDELVDTVNAGRLMSWDPVRMKTELNQKLGYDPVMVDAGTVTLKLALENASGMLEERELIYSYAPWQIKKLHPGVEIPEIEALALIEKQLDNLTRTWEQ